MYSQGGWAAGECKQAPLCPGKGDSGLMLCKYTGLQQGKASLGHQCPPASPRDKAPWGAQGSEELGHGSVLSITHLSMIYCLCEVLFVLPGLPSSPSQGQCSVRSGDRWIPKGRGAVSPCSVGAHETRAKQSPLASCQCDGLILSIPPLTVLKACRAAGDIHLTLLLYPRGYRAGVNSLGRPLR